MLYELRIYDAVAGRLPDISGRFANHTCALFRKHGVKYLGFWTDEIGRSNRLTYINVFDSMADRESRWAKFGGDPDWLEVRKQTEANGPLVDAVTNRFLRLTPYSPQPKVSTAVQELRIYEAVPGRLPDVHNRFANHTIGLFEKHGIENIGYWSEDVGVNNVLVYMLGYPSLGDREKSWRSFQADPEWNKARAASEVDGPIVRVSRHSIMRPTDYAFTSD